MCVASLQWKVFPRPFDISKLFNGTIYWYPRQEKAHFPNSKRVQQIRGVIFFIADLFQASQNKTFLRCWLWFMFVNDLKSQKNGMRHQTIMAYFFALWQKFVGYRYERHWMHVSNGEAAFFQGSWMVQYPLCLCMEWSATFGVRGTMEPDHESLLCVRDTWWEKATP